MLLCDRQVVVTCFVGWRPFLMHLAKERFVTFLVNVWLVWMLLEVGRQFFWLIVELQLSNFRWVLLLKQDPNLELCKHLEHHKLESFH